MLRRNWSAVQETANALLEHETLSGVALEALLATVQPTLLDLGPGAKAPSEEYERQREAQPEGD